MERLLQKIAKQINAFDEASLMALWDKYADQVSRFEPTRRWEEAAIVFGIIQAMRMKNQLFNYSWAQTSRPPEDSTDHPGLPSLQPERQPPGREPCGEDNSSKAGKRGKLIKLPKKDS
ncbi:MAG: hypothetical protein ACOCVM_07795 [Desulfovibrionaceae bacterium]